ncbi:MAG: MFS transporter [Candidatus Poribacteria bacterium]|nr:MFS transporter [Candidatus Poribacteria bacterium]
MGLRAKLSVVGRDYSRLFSNSAFRLLWTGQTVSAFGDAFFNVTVAWIVWSETRSTLQTAIIQAIWQLPDILFAPLAGVMADRWDRKRIMLITNLLAAVAVGAVAIIMASSGQLSPLVAYLAIFTLNSLTTFLNPARASIMPAVVGPAMLTTASGMFSAANQAASLLGNAMAGFVISVAGSIWALVIDALSFVFVSLSIAAAPLPKPVDPLSKSKHSSMSLSAFLRDMRDGWRTISRHPVIHMLVWLAVLVNVSAFTGALYPALIQERLGGGAATYGVLMAGSVCGGMLGGMLAGPIERRFGAGRVLACGWAIAGICTIAIAGSTWPLVTLTLEALASLGITVSAITNGAILVTSVSDEYRGRVFGICRALSVIVIPVSAVGGGWLAEIIGVVPMYSIAGVYMLVLVVLAWGTNPHLRSARV